MSSQRIAVVFPSRGLTFSRTAEELLSCLKGYDHKIFFSHRKPLPKCFEDPTLEALKGDFTHIWFVEDDMILRPDTLKKLLEKNADVVTADYPVNENGRGAVLWDKDRRVVYCGTGCLLVKKEVFEKLKKPYFTDQISWIPYNMGEKKMKFVGVNLKGEYGHHDVTFCMKLNKAGYEISVIKQRLGQRKLVELGKSGSNNGAHNVENWRKVTKDLVLDQVTSQPLSLTALNKLIVVDTPTGGIQTSKKHAESLVKQGLATYPEEKATFIDDSEVKI